MASHRAGEERPRGHFFEADTAPERGMAAPSATGPILLKEIRIATTSPGSPGDISLLFA